MLEQEAQRLAERLAESTSELEALQVRSCQADAEAARELPALRCAFRKRLRNGHSSALQLSCALAVLGNHSAKLERWRPGPHVPD